MKSLHDTPESVTEQDSWFDFAAKTLVVVGTIVFFAALVLTCVFQAQGKLP
jgi:hypothetical protein